VSQLHYTRNQAAGHCPPASLPCPHALTLLQPRGCTVMPDAKKEQARATSTPHGQSAAAATAEEGSARVHHEIEAQLPFVCRLDSLTSNHRPRLALAHSRAAARAPAPVTYFAQSLWCRRVQQGHAAGNASASCLRACRHVCRDVRMQEDLRSREEGKQVGC
jgi:hypothetical protein